MVRSFSQTTARSHARLVFFCCGVVHCSFVFSSEGKGTRAFSLVLCVYSGTCIEMCNIQTRGDCVHRTDFICFAQCFLDVITFHHYSTILSLHTSVNLTMFT